MLKIGKFIHCAIIKVCQKKRKKDYKCIYLDLKL